jgi:hypothetical protein
MSEGYNYHQLTDGSVVYSSGAYVGAIPTTSQNDSVMYAMTPTLQNMYPQTYFTPNPQVEIDITLKKDLSKQYALSIISFGLLSASVVCLIFLFSYLWYSIVMSYETLMIIAIVGCSIVGVLSFISLIICVISFKKYKYYCDIAFDQSGRIFL